MEQASLRFAALYKRGGVFLPERLNDKTEPEKDVTLIKTQLRGSLLLVLTAFIWGTAFVAQSTGLNYVGPFTFNGVRFLLSGVVLVPCIFLLDRLAGRDASFWGTSVPAQRKTLLFGGICCGAALAAASSLQQIGIAHTTVGKAGFLTALYIVFVPLLGLFARKRVAPRVWGGVVLAVMGMYLLCVKDGFSPGLGDSLILLSAACFALHILIISHFTQKADGVRLSCIQFFTCGAVCCSIMFFVEAPSLPAILSAWQPLLYAGIFSGSIAYTLQVIAQRGVNPTAASLILSLESVFAVLAGWLLLGQALTCREIAGCALVFLAILLVQIQPRSR